MRLTKISLALLAAFATSAAFAGTATYSGKDDKKAVAPVECPPDTLTSVFATGDYAFHDELKRGNGTLDVAHEEYQLDQRIPLSFLNWPNQECGHWYLRLGADYERFDYTIHNETRLPNTLQSIAGIVALEYLVKGQTAILISSQPGVYFEHKINSGSFDAPTNIAAAIPIFGGDRFYLIAGVRLSLLDKYPVLPIGGVLWHISDKWDLRAYLPNPRLVYTVSDNLEFYAGGEIIGNAYKTDNRQTDPQKLSGAVITYDDIRAGAGVTFKMKPVTFDFGAGYSIQKEFDYDRAGESFKSKPAPYIRLTARLDF